MTHASLSADHGIPWNPKSLRQAIRRLEADAVDVERQAIRILPYPGDGLVTVGLVNPGSVSKVEMTIFTPPVQRHSG